MTFIDEVCNEVEDHFAYKKKYRILLKRKLFHSQVYSLQRLPLTHDPSHFITEGSNLSLVDVNQRKAVNVVFLTNKRTILPEKKIYRKHFKQPNSRSITF